MSNQHTFDERQKQHRTKVIELPFVTSNTRFPFVDCRNKKNISFASRCVRPIDRPLHNNFTSQVFLFVLWQTDIEGVDSKKERRKEKRYA
jgi:hypothetical protein